MKSLKAQNSFLTDTCEQIEIIEHGQRDDFALVPFQEKLQQSDLYPLRPTQIEILQINIGKMCNQTCTHCHVDAGPDRKEIMSKETMQLCIDVLQKNEQLTTIDITGGAPELNPHFRWFVEEISKLDRHILVRCNLTIIRANKKYYNLPQFYKKHKIEVVSSLPCYTKATTDSQRGIGVFDESIKALQMLNEEGYGQEGSGLILNLVYNPGGVSLPPPQKNLEKEYKEALKQRFGIEFNNLFVITNMPINRFLDYLLTSGNYESYTEKMVNAYNPVAAENVMCRNTISVSWDGYLHDCDFNQMLDLKVDCAANHISQFNIQKLNSREIITGQHCYGCTAGSGSSCSGAVA